MRVFEGLDGRGDGRRPRWALPPGAICDMLSLFMALLHIDIASSDRAYVFRTCSARASSERWAQSGVTGKVSRPVDRPAGGSDHAPCPRTRAHKIRGRRHRREGRGLPARDVAAGGEGIPSMTDRSGDWGSRRVE